jgi:SsrA-binding protein
MSLIVNKKAHFNYEILEKYEAGIELLGSEVKSIRNKQGNIDSAYVIIRGGEVFLINADIPPYQIANKTGVHERIRNRKLLLNKKEVLKFETSDQKGLTVVPISLYSKGPKIKVEIAVVRGKKKFDKRESIKKRDLEREIGRTLKK